MIHSKKRFAINVMMNWAATAVNFVVPFFLTPFVIHHLGAPSYGIWILAVSMASYLGLLDLGLRSAIVRFVSKAEAQADLGEAKRSIGAALWIRLWASAGVALASSGLAYLAPHLFKVPPGLGRAAQITVLMCGLSVAITLASGVFNAVLTAINRFDLLSGTTITRTVFRAGGVLLLLHAGYGLISLAYWEVIVNLAIGILILGITIKIFPPARVRIRRPETRIVRMLWSYSFITFVWMMAVQVIINTDSLVIGACISVEMVAYFTIGSSLVAYAQQVAQAVSSTFVPMASGLEASGRLEDLQRMLIRGTQAMLGLSLPIAAALYFRGGTFIALWVGSQYSRISETVLKILTISLFFAMANATGGAIMLAIGKHGPVAKWTVFEALLNLGISIILAKTIGVNGVAWGTSLSMAATHLCFWPRYVRKVLGISPARYIAEGWGKITLCCIPFAVVCAWTDHLWLARNLIDFFSQILVVLPIYGICLLVAFQREVREILRSRQASAALR